VQNLLTHSRENPMSRLRRLNSGSRLFHVAAEVLEVRSLLSAGGAAAHAAMHHAATHDAVGQTHAAGPLVAFHGAASATVNIGDDKVDSPAHLSVSKFEVALGSKVKASFSLSIPQQGTHTSIKGTFSGTIINIAGSTMTLAPTSGSMTYSQKSAGKTVKATATPDGNQLELSLVNGAFFVIDGTDSFPPNAPLNLGGKSIDVELHV
jgi:hypothetical protein